MIKKEINLINLKYGVPCIDNDGRCIGFIDSYKILDNKVIVGCNFFKNKNYKMSGFGVDPDNWDFMNVTFTTENKK